MIGKYVIIRSDGSGVWAGTLVSEEGDTVEISNARRIWYWDGAATLSELSQLGTSKPEGCKFPMEVPLVKVLGVSEILPCSEKARESIAAVSIWTAHD